MADHDFPTRNQTRRRGRRRLEERHPDVLDLIGSHSVKDLAKRYGVTPQTIYAAAKRHGLSTRTGLPSNPSKRSRAGAIPGGTFYFCVFRCTPGEDGEDDDYSLLNSYYGVRVYRKGHLDPRLLMGGEPPYMATLDDARDYMLGQFGQHAGEHRPCLVDLNDGIRVFGESMFVPAHLRDV